MVQIIIILVLAAGVLAGLGGIYKKGGDARESALRVELQKEKDKLTKDKQDHEAVMRDFASGLTKNYLAFVRGNDKLAEGAKDAIREEIRNNPDLRRACLPAGGVRDFNATGVGGRSAGNPAPAAGNGVVPGKPPAVVEGKSPGR